MRGLVLMMAMAAGAMLLPTTAHAAGKVDCEMRFSVSSWSAFYKAGKGTGTITCNNGQTLAVKIRTRGGGLTFGKSSIEGGLGKFTEVDDISDLLGTYVSAEAHAGAVKSAKGQVVTKGEVSLALAGKGRGWDLGVAFGKFEIKRR